MTDRVVVVPTGTANTASILAAFNRLGAHPELAVEISAVEEAERLVLPGVGSFGAAMAELDRIELREVLAGRLAEGRATLAICVGMQLLAAASEESAGVDGLGHLDVEVTRFPGTVTVPQLGWNQVLSGGESRFVTDGWAYFANSYRMESAPAGWTVALSDHGGTFVAALERDDVLACQFHPELSGVWGSRVLERWLSEPGGAV